MKSNRLRKCFTILKKEAKHIQLRQDLRFGNYYEPNINGLGLCQVIGNSRKFSIQSKSLLMKYIDKQYQYCGYSLNGFIIFHNNKKHLYRFEPGARKVRLNYIDKQIKKLSHEKTHKTTQRNYNRRYR